MNDAIRVFHERKVEIDLYFNFLEDLMLNNAQLALSDKTKKKIDPALPKILRANGFLLIYNVVESSISKGIESIYLDMINKGVDYNSVTPNIQEEIIGNIKNNISTKKIISDVKNIAIDIINHYPRKLVSGNIDAKKIKNLAEQYGFSSNTDAKSTKNGEKLLIVKSRRNALAHGEISFQECGKEYTIQDMIEIKKEVIRYLEEILTNIQLFLSKEGYKS